MTDPQQHAAEQAVVLSVEPGGAMHVDRDSLPIVPAGEPLNEHEVYLDIANPGHGPSVAMPGQTAASGNKYVAEKDVEPAIWDLLIREDGEAKLQNEAAATDPVPGMQG